MTQEKPIIIDIAEPAENQAQTVIDVLVGSFGLAGAIAILAVILGAALAGIMLWLRSRKPLSGS
jgi:hypothetical protein